MEFIISDFNKGNFSSSTPETCCCLDVEIHVKSPSNLKFLRKLFKKLLFSVKSNRRIIKLQGDIKSLVYCTLDQIKHKLESQEREEYTSRNLFGDKHRNELCLPTDQFDLEMLAIP